jgi:hypothetical protein
MSRPATGLSKSATADRWWRHALALLCLFAGNLALYWGAVDLGFLSVDDPDYVVNNPYIGSLSRTNLKFILTQPYSANYAPVNLLSYALDVAVAGGKHASAIHLSSVVWHGVVVCMVYLLAFTIRRDLLVATAAAALFLVHPTHVEVVAWLSSRKDLVATAFAVLSMSCYLLYRRSLSHTPAEDAETKPAASSQGVRKPGDSRKNGRKAKPAAAISTVAARALPQATTAQSLPSATPQLLLRQPAFWWYTGSLIGFLLASAAKQSVLLLPAVMLAWDLIVEKRRRWTLLGDKVAFGLIAAFFGWMTWNAQPPTRQVFSPFILAGTEWSNLWLLTGLGKYVLYRVPPKSADWSVAGQVLIIGAAVLIWASPLVPMRFRQRTRAALGYWILISMVPPMVLNFIVPITDRYLFLPSVGVCILLADFAMGRPGATRNIRTVGLILLSGIGLVWAAKTAAYLAEWRDPRSIWYGAHLKTRNSEVSRFLGEVYHEAGDRIDGFIKSGTALRVSNETVLVQAVLGNTVRAEALQKEWLAGNRAGTNSSGYRDLLWRSAWEQYQQSLANRGTLSAPNLFMERGRLLVSLGQFKASAIEFTNALAFAQASSYERIRQETVVHALRALGTAYWHLGDYRTAQPFFIKAQQVQRASGQVWIASIDQEVAEVTALAAAQPPLSPNSSGN